MREQLRVRLSNAAYGCVMRLLFNPRLSPRAMRRNFATFASTPQSRLQRLHPSARFRSLCIHGVPTESIVATPRPERVLLYLHGGGYVFGSIETYRRRALKLSYRCRAEVILPDYRLAPEHPFPAALDDAQAAWQWLASTRPAHDPLLLAGDSGRERRSTPLGEREVWFYEYQGKVIWRATAAIIRNLCDILREGGRHIRNR